MCSAYRISNRANSTARSCRCRLVLSPHLSSASEFSCPYLTVQTHPLARGSARGDRVAAGVPGTPAIGRKPEHAAALARALPAQLARLSPAHALLRPRATASARSAAHAATVASYADDAQRSAPAGAAHVHLRRPAVAADEPHQPARPVAAARGRPARDGKRARPAREASAHALAHATDAHGRCHRQGPRVRGSGPRALHRVRRHFARPR